MKPTILIVSTNSQAQSRSRAMAKYCEQHMRFKGQSVTTLELSQQEGQELLVGDEDMQGVRRAFRQASHVIFAVPIYVYDVASPAKRLVEALSEAELGDRVVGFLCSAGGHRSFMSVMSFANSLMLNFRCWIVPRFVYATPEDFNGPVPLGPIEQRMERLCRELVAVRPLSREDSADELTARGVQAVVHHSLGGA